MAQFRSNFSLLSAAITCHGDTSQSLSCPQLLHEDVVRHEIGKFESDGPGKRSLAGPRHDNDKIYINEIAILPTAYECFSLRPPWMPPKDIDFPHLMPNGYARNIDVHFRLLRHDSIEKIRDINYNTAQKAFLNNTSAGQACTEDFFQTKIGN